MKRAPQWIYYWHRSAHWALYTCHNDGNSLRSWSTKHDCEHLNWSQMLPHFHRLVKPDPFAWYSSTPHHIVMWDQLEQCISMATMDITSSFAHLVTWRNRLIVHDTQQNKIWLCSLIIHYLRPFLGLFPTEILLQTQHHDAKWSRQSQWVRTAMPKPSAYAWAHLHLLVKWGDLCVQGLKTACLHRWLG